MNKKKEKEQKKKEEVPDYAKNMPFPVNNLDSAWLSASPDYTELQNQFKLNEFSVLFEFFNSAIRLGNLKGAIITKVRNDLSLAKDSLMLGFESLALDFFFDVATAVEVSQGEKGFRTKAMNMVIQKIEQTKQTKKKGVMGNNKEDDD